MVKELDAKFKNLPPAPGVYFFKDGGGQTIYIGKAANLRNRVRQYFQASRYRDAKTEALVSEISDVDWTELSSEADALFLEAELIRRYQPRFNILLRDDKSLQYVRIDNKSDYPTVRLVRRPLDDGARYFGPYLNGLAVKKALRYLRRAFPFATDRPAHQKRVSLHYHLGLDPGLEEGRTSLTQYRANLGKLARYLRGGGVALLRDLEKEMKQAAKNKEYERAARLRNQFFAVQTLNKQILFGDYELQDANKDEALLQLANLLQLKTPPGRIEGYDVSHMQGSDTTASMVVFSSGVPEKTAYRKFKMRSPGNDDFAHINETLTRRFSQKNVKKWPLPDLILIDGGKGQLKVALKAGAEAGLADIPMIGLAKREEEIILKKTTTPQNSHSQGATLKIVEMAKGMGAYVTETKEFITILLPPDSPAVKLLQRIRDESHRFAISYHTSLKRIRQKGSVLDDIPGVGAKTRKKLIRRFGSARAVVSAPPSQLQAVLGQKRGRLIADYLKNVRRS